MDRSLRLATLGSLDAGEDLPTQFLIFAAGSNDSTQGAVIFDDAAAASVMARFEEHGVDVMLDLEHDSLDSKARAQRSDAADALAWFRLSVVEGALWAVDVRWTNSGAERLRSRKQRYTSPAFLVDSESRVVELINVALVSMPATHKNAPLIAAGQFRRFRMDPSLIMGAIEALKNQDGEKALALLEEMIASSAGAAAPEEPEAPPAEEPVEEAAEPPVEEEDEEQAAMRALSELLGKRSAGAVVEAVRDLKARDDAARAARAKLEASERVELVSELVSLGAEIPATAWVGDAAQRVPCKRLTAEPIAELRGRVKALREVHSTPARPPSEGTRTTVSARASKLLDTPEKRARFEALRNSRRAR